MMSSYRKMTWSASVLLILLLGLSGCEFFEQDDDDLSRPAQQHADGLANFYGTESISEQFEWNSGREVLCLNVPEDNTGQKAFLLQYTVTSDAAQALAVSGGQSSSAAIVFQAKAGRRPGARLYIGFENSYLQAFTLYRATLKADAQKLFEEREVIRYATPGVPSITWEDVLQDVDWDHPLEVGKGNTECPPPTVISTKKQITRR